MIKIIITFLFFMILFFIYGCSPVGVLASGGATTMVVAEGDRSLGSVVDDATIKLNISANCIDRHAAKTPDRTAIIWEGDDPTVNKAVSYVELKNLVCQMANVLKGRGVKKGDRVTIYMPMVPEAAVAMLACTRIGAIHSVVFGGFAPNELALRIDDALIATGPLPLMVFPSRNRPPQEALRGETFLIRVEKSRRKVRTERKPSRQ